MATSTSSGIPSCVSSGRKPKSCGFSTATLAPTSPAPVTSSASEWFACQTPRSAPRPSLSIRPCATRPTSVVARTPAPASRKRLPRSALSVPSRHACTCAPFSTRTEPAAAEAMESVCARRSPPSTTSPRSLRSRMRPVASSGRPSDGPRPMSPCAVRTSSTPKCDSVLRFASIRLKCRGRGCTQLAAPLVSEDEPPPPSALRSASTSSSPAPSSAPDEREDGRVGARSATRVSARADGWKTLRRRQRLAPSMGDLGTPPSYSTTSMPLAWISRSGIGVCLGMTTVTSSESACRAPKGTSWLDEGRDCTRAM